MVNLNKHEFVTSVYNCKNLPEQLPEFIFLGKSNVGKSSLINKLLNRRNFARVSSVPGKTASINYYKIDDALYFADLPGYGFAKVSKSVRDSWGVLTGDYFNSPRDRRHIFFLVDIRHAPTDNDRIMADYLVQTQLPFTVVCTKQDKLKKSVVETHISVIREQLELSDDVKTIAFSSQTGAGRDEILQMVFDLI